MGEWGGGVGGRPAPGTQAHARHKKGRVHSQHPGVEPPGVCLYWPGWGWPVYGMRPHRQRIQCSGVQKVDDEKGDGMEWRTHRPWGSGHFGGGGGGGKEPAVGGGHGAVLRTSLVWWWGGQTPAFRFGSWAKSPQGIQPRRAREAGHTRREPWSSSSGVAGVPTVRPPCSEPPRPSPFSLHRATQHARVGQAAGKSPAHPQTRPHPTPITSLRLPPDAR